MTTQRTVPELLAPAGSIDAVRAAVANGADSVYLGVGRFNARDDGAQLTLEELESACRIAHARGRRIYMTLNVLIKPSELFDALLLLHEAVERGIDAVIVQDLGLVSLIRKLLPKLEIHGSTQMTVHDPSGVRVVQQLGVERIVLARENTLDDIRAIASAGTGVGVEGFVHGALCISYSGQCYMSGMISERSANRGSCAQSCRKDYQLRDVDSGQVLDAGFLISARDLSAVEHLDAIADLGVSCLKIEGRKKKPEYVATVTATYRRMLDEMRRGNRLSLTEADTQPLVQIFSRGFTGGMYGGRDGRDYVTRTQPDNLGEVLGVVIRSTREGIVVDVKHPIFAGDGLGFDDPDSRTPGKGFKVERVSDLSGGTPGMRRMLIHSREQISAGWRVVRSSRGELVAAARASFDAVESEVPRRRVPLSVSVWGKAGKPLRAKFSARGYVAEVASNIPLAPAQKRSIDAASLREYFGRLGETEFVIASIDTAELDDTLFVPVSELNHMRRAAVELLSGEMTLERSHSVEVVRRRIQEAIAQPDVSGHNGAVPTSPDSVTHPDFGLCAEVWRVEDVLVASDAGATEVVLDIFLRHPTPPVTRVLKAAQTLRERGQSLRLRTPTIVRPEDRPGLEKWLKLPLPLLTGHLGLLHELASEGRDVVADYATNCFNQHTAGFLFSLGASQITLSIELTTQEMADVAAPWSGRNFAAVVYGRPEGMTLEHCVLSAAFDREPTTCRDLCVQKHPNVLLTDPAGYSFPVATDSDCRNRLLHSRPIEGSEYLHELWARGLRSYRMIFNTPGDSVAEVVSAYRVMCDNLVAGIPFDAKSLRADLRGEFTRGHFARPV